MNMPELTLYAAAGAALGGLYLAALWLTVTGLARARRPFVLLAASMLLRMGALLAAFALVSGLEWQRLAACLAGFVIARLAATAWPGRTPARRESPS